MKINILIVGIIFFCTMACKKESVNPNKLTYSDAVRELPLYNNFIEYLKNEGYEFWDFHKYWISDKSTLPNKLMVLRHDIHHRDIEYAYYTYLIENELLGNNVATYFILLNHPWCESTNDYNNVHQDYIKLIDFLKSKNVDIQPHISPADIYVADMHPYWDVFSVERLSNMINNNYSFNYYDDGLDIIIKGVDSLCIDQMNHKLSELLLEYNTNWTKETGLEVEYYAAHGSAIALNHALGNTKILNQRVLLKTGIYEFDTFCTLITKKLHIIHDNERPNWIEKPSLIEIDIYELLIHPYVWKDPQSWRDDHPGYGTQ